MTIQLKGKKGIKQAGCKFKKNTPTGKGFEKGCILNLYSCGKIFYMINEGDENKCNFKYI